jgi:Histidine kinase/Y_Y_Y domain
MKTVRTFWFVGKIRYFCAVRFCLLIMLWINVVNAFAQGVMNTYTFPANEAKTNYNGGVVTDNQLNYYGAYYFGQNTRIKNAMEIDFPQIEKSKQINFAYYINKDSSIFIAAEHLYLLANNKMYLLINNYPFKETDQILFNNRLEGFLLRKTETWDRLCYFTKNKLIILDSVLTGEGGFHILAMETWGGKQTIFKNDGSQLLKMDYLYNQKLNEKIIPFNKTLKGIFHISISSKYGYLFESKIGQSFIITDTTGKTLTTYFNNKCVLKKGVLFNEQQKHAYYPIENLNNNTKQIYGYNGLLLNIIPCNNNSAYLMGTDNVTEQAFTYILKYPTVFNNTHSKSIFSIAQDAKENIYIGNYIGDVVKMDRNKNVSTIATDYRTINGNLVIGDKVYFNREDYGTITINEISNGIKPIKPLDYSYAPGFCFFKSSKNIIYYGTAQKGLYYIAEKDLLANTGNWKKIDISRLGDFLNILTITEDKLGRIWFGHSRKGVVIYTPETDSVQLFLMSKNKTKIGAFSSITDAQGTVWIGTTYDGLYAVDGNKKNIQLSDFKKIKHPFFEHDAKITALTFHGKHLVVNAHDKTLVMDLDLYYKGILNIKYLSAKESSYTSFTEQNTLLTAADSTIWFSTSDMLYQWHFNDWLALPKPNIPLFTCIENNKKLDTLSEQNNFEIHPTNNSASIRLDYYTPDLLPRFFTTALQYESDSIAWNKVSTETNFSFTNLKPGDYIFHVKICELNGTLTYKQYRVTVDEFWYKKWYIITLISLAILAAILYFFRLRNQKKLADQQALTQAAQFEATIAKQKNELAQLQAITISNQFRPHFLLNTLNAIGAYLYKQPEAEKLLSRTGESINILFSQARSNNNIHAIKSEIELIKNVIEIFKIIYLKDLEVSLPNDATLAQVHHKNIPFGLLQIPIENALLHGLNNKKTGPYLLDISLQINQDTIAFTITDNGIGRNKASTLSNVRKHGTGLMNLQKIIDIYNGFNAQHLSITFTDDVYQMPEPHGTSVNIIIPNTYHYE